jgi:flavin reductase (DIM6/NTAB) family NADH-FMN oxidoreductase RutF
MPVQSVEFRRALGQFASGVTVVTTRTAAGVSQGLTVSSFCSVSLDPPLVLVCIDKRAETTQNLSESRVFAVSVLAEDQQDVSHRFAFGGAERFNGQPPSTRDGLVLIPGALAHLECRLRAAHDAGDHFIYVGEVHTLAVQPGRPLLYHASAYRRLDGGLDAGRGELG